MKHFSMVLVCLSILMVTLPADAKKWPKLSFGNGEGPKGGMKCNAFSWSTSSWSTTTDSCDYIVPMVKLKEEELQHFVEINQDRLLEQMSQGGGQILTDYATLLGCSDDAIPTFGKVSQENFNQIFSNAKWSGDILRNTRENMNRNPELREKCDSTKS